jgi:hypothetical protein
MIGQYLPNNNETATVAFHQKFCQLNSPLVSYSRSTFCDFLGAWAGTLYMCAGTVLVDYKFELLQNYTQCTTFCNDLSMQIQAKYPNVL